MGKGFALLSSLYSSSIFLSTLKVQNVTHLRFKKDMNMTTVNLDSCNTADHIVLSAQIYVSSSSKSIRTRLSQ